MRHAFALLLAGLFGLATVPVHAQKAVTLRVAHSMSANEPIHKAVESFARNVTKRADGRLRVAVFPSEQLGPLRETHEQVRQGAPIIVVTDPTFLGDYVKDFGVLMGPYLMDNPLDFKKVLASDWYGQVLTPMHEAGFHPLAFNYFFGPRHALANKPIRRPEDYQGLTMRVAPTPITIETFTQLGARAVPIAWSEVYSALAQNVVDGVEAPVASLVGSKLVEQRKVLSLTQHFNSYLGLVMSQRVFTGLAPDLQAILAEEAVKAGDAMTQMTLDNEKVLLAKLREEGITIIEDVDVAAMRQATLPVYTKFREWTPGLHGTIERILAE